MEARRCSIPGERDVDEMLAFVDFSPVLALRDELNERYASTLMFVTAPLRATTGMSCPRNMRRLRQSHKEPHQLPLFWLIVTLP